MRNNLITIKREVAEYLDVSEDDFIVFSTLDGSPGVVTIKKAKLIESP
jgi:hypothetical protein